MIPNIEKAAVKLKEADAVLITAGSGMSADSGIATFRGLNGLYESTDTDIEALINPFWFKKDPEAAWAFYWDRINEYLVVAPHQGYQYLKDIVESKPYGYFVYTSNVDGYFQKSGYSSSSIYECHGSIFKFQCSSPCSKDAWDIRAEHSNARLLELSRTRPVLECPACGAVARPNVLLFNDNTWISRAYWGQQENYRKWQLQLRGKKVVKLEIGAGTEVSTVRDESEIFPGLLIRINPEPGEMPYGSIALRASGLESLKQLNSEIMK